MVAAGVDDDAARAAEVAPVHVPAAERATPVGRAWGDRGLRCGWSGVAHDLLRRRPRAGALDDELERLGPEPQTGTARALEHGERNAADAPAVQPAARAAGRAGMLGGLTDPALRGDRGAAGVTVARPAADPRQARRADRVEIPLMQRVVGTAVLARGRRSVPRGAARRAAHDRRIVRPGLPHRDELPAGAAEAAPGGEARGVELPAAARAGHQEPWRRGLHGA